jgi:hypothetical protein
MGAEMEMGMLVYLGILTLGTSDAIVASGFSLCLASVA